MANAASTVYLRVFGVVCAKQLRECERSVRSVHERMPCIAMRHRATGRVRHALPCRAARVVIAPNRPTRRCCVRWSHVRAQRNLSDPLVCAGAGPIVGTLWHRSSRLLPRSAQRSSHGSGSCAVLARVRSARCAPADQLRDALNAIAQRARCVVRRCHVVPVCAQLGQAACLLMRFPATKRRHAHARGAVPGKRLPRQHARSRVATFDDRHGTSWVPTKVNGGAHGKLCGIRNAC